MQQDVRYRNRIGGDQPYRDDPVSKRKFYKTSYRQGEH